MKRKSRTTKNKGSKQESKKVPLPYQETVYEELNNRSFHANFNVLIHHYKKKDFSLPTKPE